MKNYQTLFLSLALAAGLGFTILNFIGCAKSEPVYTGLLCSECDKEHPCNDGLYCSLFYDEVGGGSWLACASGSSTTCTEP